MDLAVRHLFHEEPAHEAPVRQAHAGHVLRANALPRLQPAQVALNNHLLGRAARFLAVHKGQPQAWEWVWQPERSLPGPAHVQLVLRDADGECVLGLDSDAAPALGAGIDNDIDLEAFAGDARVWAASLRYAGVVGQLAALSGRAWRCHAVHPPLSADVGQAGHSGSEPQFLQLAFLLRGSHGALTRGYVRIPNAELGLWHSVQGEPAAAPPLLHTVAASLDMVLRSAPGFSSDELAALVCGALVIVGRAPAQANAATSVRKEHHLDCACVLELRGSHGVLGHALAALQGPRLHLLSALQAGAAPTWNPARSDTMNYSDTTQPATGTTTTASPTQGGQNANAQMPELLGGLAIALEFHIGQLTLPLAELSSGMVAGRVFELAQPLGPHSVALRAGGVELARGELLQVADLLAVRITQVSARGPV
jgi:flagellar motor switch/type III secretory pathway protein FliN